MNDAPAPRLKQPTGHALLRFVRDCPGTRLDDLHEIGTLHVEPAPQDAPPASFARHPPACAVLVNRAGHISNGDQLNVEIHAARGTRGVVSTRNCCNVRPSPTRSGDARLTTAARLAGEAELHWLPHPVTLHEGGALTRTLSFDLEGSARLFAVQASVFGTPGTASTPPACRSTERWRIWRDDRLLWAAEQRVQDPASEFPLPSTLDGARAVATLVYAGADAPEQIERMRELLEHVHGRAGVNCVPGVMVALMVAPGPDDLLSDLRQIIAGFTGRPLPAPWTSTPA